MPDQPLSSGSNIEILVHEQMTFDDMHVGIYIDACLCNVTVKVCFTGMPESIFGYLSECDPEVVLM